MFNKLFKLLDKQTYPFVDGLYYIFIIVFILVALLIFG